MNLIGLNTIPYWDEDEDESLPDTIPPTTTISILPAGYEDESFPSCFAERL